MSNNLEDLKEVRCPFIVKGKDGYMHSCKRLIVRVWAPSSGEAKCPRCQLSFQFEFNKQTEDLLTKVVAKAIS